MRRQDWAFFVVVWALSSTIMGLVRLQFLNALAWAAVGLVAAVAARHWSAKYPGPMPHFLRWLLFIPRPFHSRREVQGVLGARAGERILELGPGVGVHTLPVASSLGPSGALHVIDIQQPMLGALLRRATRRRLANVVAVRGDARRLPWRDRTFDAAFLIEVLGEIPERGRALQDLRRVIKPGGRLVVGEMFLDPDFIAAPTLRAQAEEAGFLFRYRRGTRWAYLARFETPEA